MAREHVPRAPELTRSQRWILVAGGLAVGLAFLDETAVVTALPTIQREFNATSAELQWVMGAYLLALASLIVAAGRLADLFGRRRLLLIGTGLFALGSILCALAPGEELLIAFRALQGMGGAFLIPLGIANATAALPDERRGWAIGIISTGATVFLALGPLIGGALVELASWRGIFLINLPALAVIALVALRSLPETRAPDRVPLDLAGLALLIGGLVALVFGLLGAQERGPTAPGTLALVGAGLVLLAALAVVERRKRAPLIDLRLLGAPAVAGSLIALFAIQFAILGLTVYLTLYLQHGLGFAPALAGALTLPTVLVAPLLSAYVGRMTDRIGPRGLVAGSMLLAALALGAIALLAGGRGVAALLPAFLMFGVARPIATVAASAGAVGAIRSEDRGLASGLVTEARQLGAVLGVAVLGLVLTSLESVRRSQLLSGIDESFGHAERAALDGILAGSSQATDLLQRLPPVAREAASEAAATSFIAGFQAAMAVTAALALLASVASWVLLRPTPLSGHGARR